MLTRIEITLRMGDRIFKVVDGGDQHSMINGAINRAIVKT